MPASKRFPCHAHRLHIAIMSVVKSPRAPSLASHAIISFCCLQQANNNSRSHSALHAYEHAADPETHAPLPFFYCARYIALENSFPTPPSLWPSECPSCRLGRGGRRGRHERVITGRAKEPGVVGAEPHALRMQIERGVLLYWSKQRGST